MTSFLFDLPIELRSLIFSSFSLRDISRLRQCCSAWKNNLQDLSFMKVLDFSYSPDITSEYFDELLEKRINRAQNSITKVILAHVTNLHEYSLQKLFSVLPRLKDIRIRHSFTEVVPATTILSILFQQQSLESIVYIQRRDALRIEVANPYNFNCTKLKRCKVRVNRFDRVSFPLAEMMRLVESSPALKHDVDFLRNIASSFYDARPDDSFHPLLDIAFASQDLRVYQKFWKQMMSNFRKPNYAPQLIDRTIQLLREMPTDQIQSNIIAHAVSSAMIVACGDGEYLTAVQEHYGWLRPLAVKHESRVGNSVNQERNLIAKLFEKLKKRPFYKQALEEFLRLRIYPLNTFRREPLLKDKFAQELNDVVACFSSILKKLPSEVCLLQASWMLRQGNAREAFDKYSEAIAPNFAFNLKNYYNNTNMQALCAAYHVAKDYLKSPELLERLSPENNKLLHEHFEKLQPCFDRGLCTRATGSKTYYKQYWYACYTCGFNGGFKGLCYSCTKACHAGHEIDYMEIAECFCDDTTCKFEEEPENQIEEPKAYEEHVDDEAGVQFQGDDGDNN